MIRSAQREVALSAGTVLPVGPEATIDVAADAGWSAVGLRPDPGASAADVASLSRRLSQRGMRAFDVEVVRLGVTSEHDADRLLSIASELGASWLLVTSHLPEPSETERALAALVHRAEALGGVTRPALEFMAFTEVRTVFDAVPIVRASGAGLVVDALHVHRNHQRPDDVATALAGAPVPLYVQLCDTDVAELPDSQLIDEARHGRLVPGAGILPLAALLAVLGADAPVTAEVQSDRLLRELGADGLARQCRSAVRALVGA